MKRGGSPDSDLDFLWPSIQSGKGVGGARIGALNYCTLAKWSGFVKWVNILLHIGTVCCALHIGVYCIMACTGSITIASGSYNYWVKCDIFFIVLAPNVEYGN